MAEATSEEPGAIRVNITTNADGWFQAVSPQFLQLIGRPVEALAGVNLVDLIHPHDVAGVRELLAGVSAGAHQGAAGARVFVAGDNWLPADIVVASVKDGRFTLDLVGRQRPIVGPDTAAAAPSVASDLDAVSPSDDDDVVPSDDSSEDAAYAAAMPGDEVPELRAAVRASAGAAATPMLEVDVDGRTVYLSGPWSTLSVEGADGADVFEELLGKSGQADSILEAMGAVFEHGRPSQHEITIADLPPRWVRLLPIPSPHRAGVVHALIAVVPESQLQEARPVRVAAPMAAPLPKRGPKTGAATSVEAGSPAPVLDAPATESRASRADGVGPQDASWPVAAEQVATDLLSEQPEPARRQMKRPSLPLMSDVQLLSSPGQSTRILWGPAGVLTYVAMQGLYLGPAYDWPSPLQGVLNSRACLVEPWCDNDVLRFNHLAVLALIGAITVFAVLFSRVGPRRLPTDRPDSAGKLAATSWQPNLTGPGLFAWLSVLAVGVVIVQTVFTDSVWTIAWIAATGCGAIAAWRSDRDASVPLGATMAALSAALSVLLVPLGIGTIWLGEHRLTGLVLLIVGGALFARSLHLNRESDSTFDGFDFGAMLGLSVLALVLGLLRHHTWRYAFIGDEWSFFEGALDGLRGNAQLDTFEIGGPNNYFTGLTFELQTSVMRLGGDDVWGWRLSSLMPMVLSVAAMYAFTRWLSGRTAALVAGVALAAGHMLLSFSMVGYNNSQSLVAVSAMFAALAWAHQRPSALRFFLFGSAVGSTFLVYAMARLALLPIGLLFLVLFRDNLVVFARRLGWATLGALAMGAPTLFSWQNWDALLKATPVQAEDPVLASGGVARQMLENTFAGWLSFIGSTRNTHFIVGPHLDVISAVLLIIGLGYVIARSRSDLVMRWFLVGGVGLWTAINAIQQYDQISNTRSFMIPLVYCVFIGIGASAILPMILKSVSVAVAKRTLAIGSLAFLALVLVGLNQWHIGSYANDRQQLTEQAMLVQQFELTESIDGQGMAVYVGWPEERNARLNMVLRAHDIAAERFVIVPSNGSLNIEEVCGRADPVMLVMHHKHPKATEWVDAMSACWGLPPVGANDPAGALKLWVIANQPGFDEYRIDPSQRVINGADTADFVLEDSIDIATDGGGIAYALTRSDNGAAIHRLDGGGSFAIPQVEPIDFDITSEGLFVVAANGGDDRLVWYDGKGSVIHRYPGREDFPTIGGLAVDGDDLWVSDTTRSRVISFDSTFKVDQIRFGQGVLFDPSSLTPGPDGGIWIFSARSGEIVLVNANDEFTVRIPAQVFNPADAPRLSSTELGWLIRTIPERPIVELVNPLGEVVDARGGMNRPRAAASRQGELVVADPRWHDVPVLAVDGRWAPAERGTIAWGTRSVGSNALGVYNSPFVSDDLLEAGPISIELIETEAVAVGDDQLWRQIGAAVVGEVHAIAATEEGAFVADQYGRVIRVDAEGAALSATTLGGGGSSFVSDMISDDSGGVWVLDAGLGRVSSVDTEGVVSMIETDSGPLRNARGLGAGANNTLWVASTAAAQLINITPGGAIVSTIPLPARQPTDVVELDDGTLWIVDAQEMELLHLASNGDVLVVLSLDPFSSVESPHLAVIGDTLWVTESEMSAIFAVDLSTDQPSGERIELMRPDGARVNKPIGISAAPDGRIWVADSIGGAIVILS